jgi:tripartite-type tricarboxylate transporter receptor subunit TctC
MIGKAGGRVRRGIAFAALVAGLALPAPAALAQDYPSKPVKLIVPYLAGGAADIFGRIMAQKLSEALHKNFLVENRPGANGGIGTEVVAKSAPDGYTLLATASGPIVVNPSLYTSVPYDVLKDFAPVAQGVVYQYVMVVIKSSPVHSLADLVAMAKASPGAVSYGSTGIGGGNHLAGELLGLMTGAKMTHVPYKGSAGALTDLLGGHLTFMFDTVITSVPHIQTGELRAFAVSSRKRASSLPDVPTLDEMGLKGFDISQWQGILAPAATPKPIVARLNAEIVKALAQPDVRERLVTQGGNEIVTGSPDDFAALIRSDLDTYAKLIKAAGIQPQ